MDRYNPTLLGIYAKRTSGSVNICLLIEQRSLFQTMIGIITLQTKLYLKWYDCATYFIFWMVKVKQSVFVGRCHYSTARPQVADGGTASDTEGSCE